MASFEIHDGLVLREGRPLLRDLDLRLPSTGVTVLLGPGGTGKSVLCRALSGKLGNTGLAAEGRWLHRGLPVFRSDAEKPIVHMVQAPLHRDPDAYLVDVSRAVGEAVDKKYDLLIDEAVDRLPTHSRTDAAEVLALARDKVAVVLVTHDVALARSVADHVVLIAGGSLVTSCDARTFFDSPPNELAARFVQQGNCWPAASGPALPPHFRYIIDGRLAGMGKPGLFGAVEEDLEAIALAGISTLVSLTERPFPPEQLRPYGISGRHFPIEDMGVPPIRTAVRLCAEVDRAMGRGEGVAFHCHAGLGRTGTMLAAVLVFRGASPGDAVAQLRSTGRAYVQSRSQMSFIDRFAEELA